MFVYHSHYITLCLCVNNKLVSYNYVAFFICCLPLFSGTRSSIDNVDEPKDKIQTFLHRCWQVICEYNIKRASIWDFDQSGIHWDNSKLNTYAPAGTAGAMRVNSYKYRTRASIMIGLNAMGITVWPAITFTEVDGRFGPKVLQQLVESEISKDMLFLASRSGLMVSVLVF